MDSARERLTAASHKLAEQMYKATQAAAGGAPGAGPAAGGPGAAAGTNGAGQQNKKDEGVIDAEYVDVEDKK
jgi:molecular chaperone DnaK